MAAHSYESAYPPAVPVDAGIRAFLEQFYRISDMPDAHERYTEQFAAGATLVMASKKVVGREGTFSSSFEISFFPLPRLTFPWSLDLFSSERAERGGGGEGGGG